MFVIKVGDGVELRAAAPAYAAELFGLVEANRQHLRAWLPWLDEAAKQQQVERFLRECRRKADDGNGQTFLLMVEGRIAGVVGQHYIDRLDRGTELGYWLDAQHQGRGLMTRAVSRLVDHIFVDLDLNRVVLRCATENTRSRAVPERLGFSLEGVLREAQWLYDRYVDLAIYALLQGDWRSQSSSLSRSVSIENQS